jgi:primosomal protein N' (replication factor Y) (superfamily II helicase)
MSIVRGSVAIPRPVRRLFTYTIPPDLLPRCQRGVRVVVPFGRRRLTGYLIEVGEGAGEPRAAVPLKSVEEVLDPDPVLSESILELTRWGAEYYLVSWGEMIRAALPGMKAVLRKMVVITALGRRALQAGEGGLGAPEAKIARNPAAREALGLAAEFSSERGTAIRLEDLKKRLGPRFNPSLLSRLAREGLVEVTEVATAPGPRPRLVEQAILQDQEGRATQAGPAGALRLGARQREVLEALARAGGRIAVAALLEQTHAGRATLRSLEGHGRVRIEAVEVPRRPFLVDQPADPAPPLYPTPDQQVAIEAIGALLGAGEFATCLLQGVTGSGKTEVYLKSIEAAVASGRRALYLVPEIGLTPLLARRMRARFGDVLAVLHSGLSEGERYDEWRRIRDGRVDVVLGARSAVFAPISDLGLIVVDEEQDASYKQEEYPRYNGRDLAIVRGKMAGSVVILGSATPSVESYHRALRGKYRLLGLPARVGAAGLPLVERVDMRREFQEVGRESILSRRLLAALEERVGRREQSLVLLNRRGFSTFVLCRACGEQVGCRRCSIAMTLHLRERRLRCHYCDDSRKVPDACPSCGSGHLHFGGTGTERLEQVLQAALPGARLERMDRDTVRGRGSVEGILTRVERGEVDVLLGTQMIAKGHDFPNVTLVGVLAADALLGFPDFRAAERTFQLLAQVAGRSGRGERPGEVIVQAYDADHHAIRAACEHDFQGFASKELAYRSAMNYPPFSALAAILVKDRVFDRARAGAATVASILRGRASRSLQILGPAPAPLERLRGDYRVQVIVKAASRRERQTALAELLEELDRRKSRVENLVIDVDPISTL